MRVDHVEKYRLPKNLLEKEEAKESRSLGPGHAYEDKELATDYNLDHGHDLFAPPPAEKTVVDQTDGSSKQEKRIRKEERDKKRQGKEERKRQREGKQLEREERKRQKRARHMKDEDDNKSETKRNHKRQREDKRRRRSDSPSASFRSK
jgi:hypothetical protein